MRRDRVVPGVGVGLLCAASAIAAAELAAAFVSPAASPVLAVGDATIDLAPEWLTSFAIRTFGTANRAVLVGGIVLFLGAVASVLGVAALRRRWVGEVGLAVMALVGIAAVASRSTARPVDVLPTVLGAVAGVAVLRALLARAPRASEEVGAGRQHLLLADRRAFLRAGVVVGVGAALAVVAGRTLSSWRFGVVTSRAQVRIPSPDTPAPPLPEDVDLGLEGVEPFFTPNDRFYRVDTALLAPRVEAADWRLRIHGMVDREIHLDFDQLLARPTIERDITLACVSNEVGGPYVGNARWVGLPLKDLLDEAGVDPAGDQLVSRSADGFTIGTPTSIATDGRDAMLAVAMNGEPLPVDHGFPVRMIVPGLYGYNGAMKWIVDIELTTFDAYDAYWVERGWVREAPIETMARIDTPRGSVAARRVAVAGVAWAQHRGISAVEVRVDGGPWSPARLAAADTIDTWRQWVWDWDTKPGRHTLEARATDGDGAVQTGEPSPPFPDGATGWHAVTVTVP
jgi:DMSO/TMAO reductase YedYZ molybdopterin-dependent catalytic subunit